MPTQEIVLTRSEQIFNLLRASFEDWYQLRAAMELHGSPERVEAAKQAQRTFNARLRELADLIAG